MRRRIAGNVVSIAFLLLLGMVVTSSVQAQTSFTTLYTFGSNPTYGTKDGSYPDGAVLLDSRGNLYGTAEYGGSNTYGAVFKLSPPPRRGGNWSETLLYSFGAKTYQVDGSHPVGNLIADSSGNLYGVTYSGGTGSSADDGGNGTVFMLSKAGRLTSLYSFTGACVLGVGCEGATPMAGVIMDSAGNLYGTTEYGGNSGYGTVYKLSPPARRNGKWSQTVLHSFTGLTDGAYPIGGLVMDTKGNLYGTTYNGGDADSCGFGCGLVFKLDAANSYAYSVIYAFGNGAPYTGASTFGYDPAAGLAIDSAGNLYGTTEIGGDWQRGTVFKLDAANGYACAFLYSFGTNGLDGQYPMSAVTVDPNGNVYGTTALDGNHSNGTVFKLAFDSVNNIYSWAWSYSLGAQTTDGIYPYANLIQDANGNLYGTTTTDPTNYSGTIFKVTP